MSNDIKRIKLDPRAFIAALPHPEEGVLLCGDGIISVYLADILNEAGIEAEAQYQNYVWCVAIKGKKCYGEYDDPNDQEDSFLRSIQGFSDQVNSMSDFEAWYSYRNNTHCLNLREKEPLESLNDLFN